ncbi:hypothetical protein [Halobacterium wangiae]|uniref:hypothetical protein n=1 Tax=Halobacterium wangiae TaxID=2902623 RepID=UPI001E357CCE|nr:hypothetical protein [Halobacterium wangiae]
MQEFPPTPPVESAPAALFDGGHLWLQEWVDGAPLRFRLLESGLLQFGSNEAVFDSEDVPLGYRHATRHVREQFDRDVLRGALDDVESAVFFGIATRRQAIDYDWARTPAFLGLDVWTADGDRLLPPDAVEALYDRLGLAPVNAVQKEVRATDFDPTEYALPSSNWYDGPAAGVLVRNKTGDRARISGPSLDESPDPFDGDAADAAVQFIADERIEATAERLRRDGRRADVDAVVERVVEAVAREEFARLFDPDASVDPDAFRSAVAERASRVLG